MQILHLRKQLAVRVNGQIRGWLSLIQVLTGYESNTLINKFTPKYRCINECLLSLNLSL